MSRLGVALGTCLLGLHCYSLSFLLLWSRPQNQGDEGRGRCPHLHAVSSL